MEPSNEIVFEVMVMYIEVLKREIDDYNTRHNTNFEIYELSNHLGNVLAVISDAGCGDERE